jgi:flavin-dependent dehydrogenase
MKRQQPDLLDQLAPGAHDADAALQLDDGSRVAVIGGGPAGSLFSFFLLKMAEAIDLELDVDIYEPRSFERCGPAGCNHCGGIVSESLVQILATEGVNLPPSVVQRGIESYVVHMDVGSVEIDSPAGERRIAALYRGNGPREGGDLPWDSFDGYLQGIAMERGARVVRKLVTGVQWEDGRPGLVDADGRGRRYDLVAVAAGVNSNFLDLLEIDSETPKAPRTTRTYICEFRYGRETIERVLGNSMHVFLLDLPRLEFAAIIPKGEFVTLCLLGEELDQELVHAFLDSPVVKRCFPDESVPAVCSCSPLINMGGARRPFGDRVVLIGDCGVTRLYKDGIGAAYRTSKAAAATAVFQGISADAFQRHYWPSCRAIARDNAIGKGLFAASTVFKHVRLTRRAILRMTRREQEKANGARHMSSLLWNMFTGSAPYREIFVGALHPGFVGSLLWNLALGARPNGAMQKTQQINKTS